MIDNAPIAAQFQSILGRQATPEELSYFAKHISEGNLDPYEIGKILQSTPEFQTTQLNKNTQAFGDTLNAQNGAILDMAGAKAQSRFAGLGRPNTSAMGASVMQAGGQLAQQRQSALADFYGRGLQNNAGMAAQQGEGLSQRGYGLRDEQKRRNWQIEDYYREKNAFEDSKNASSGWKAITPEFVIGAALGTGGKIGASYAGGMAAKPKSQGGGGV